MSTINFSGLIPGTSIKMAIIIGQYIGSEKCPRLGCGSRKSNFQGVFGRPHVGQPGFTMWYSSISIPPRSVGTC